WHREPEIAWRGDARGHAGAGVRLPQGRGRDRRRAARRLPAGDRTDAACAPRLTSARASAEIGARTVRARGRANGRHVRCPAGGTSKDQMSDWTTDAADAI